MSIAPNQIPLCFPFQMGCQNVQNVINTSKILHFQFQLLIFPSLRTLVPFPFLSRYPASLFPHLQVKTSDFSLHVLHLTKQHQWNLQLHCQTRV